MTLLSPGWLVLLVPVAALAAGYAVMQLRRSKVYAVRFTNMALLDSIAPQRPAWRRHVPAALFLLAAVALVVAAARPARDVEVPKERATVVLAIDTSLSMMATDVEPSRIDAAKEAAIDFLDDLPPKINVGLVSFNGIAYVNVAPTTDRVLVANAIADLELGESTAIGDAIFAGLEAIQSVPVEDGEEIAPARIVLMSDGETTVGRPDAMATAAANDVSVPVSTIAFGTADGEITIEGEVAPIPVPVNSVALRAIAETTSGSFFTADTADELSRVYADIGSAIGYDVESREITGWFIGIALVSMLAAGGFSLLWFSRLP
ncbi:MAG: VWA domain-containing protein [Actinomycetota bacterium]|nr:VWA domain-containing protein [Actinomycetota bacterium]